MNKLNILWTTDNKDTFQHMLVMYAINSKANGWWDEITIIIWGASARLAGTDPEVQADIKEMIENGIKIEACKACTDHFGVSKVLFRLGIDVKFMGEPLTEYIRSGDKMLTI
jgi:hypothetical protein